jgi:3-keto-disaccharide hydrolase
MLIRSTTTALLVALLALLCHPTANAAERQKMFNGKNLDGWTVSRCEAAVEDGVLLLKDGNGLVYLEGPYSDFVFEFKWKARDPKMWDSGVYFRCDAPPKEGQRPWPKRYQVNLRKGMEGNVGALPDARCKGLTKPGEWNEMKLTCIGAKAKLEFNGKVAWEAKGLEQEKGIIALQAETPGGGQFEFKDIYLTKLDKK